MVSALVVGLHRGPDRPDGPTVPSRVQGLADSADYLPAFLLGFAYAHVPLLRGLFRRHFALAAAISAAALGTTWTLIGLGAIVPDRLATLTGLLADAAMSWAMVIVCFNLAERLLNRDHRWRGPLAAAVFPACIVHQTAIVLAGWEQRQLSVVGAQALAMMLIAVIAVCALACVTARLVPGMVPLLGMPSRRKMLPPLPGWRASVRTVRSKLS